MKRLPSVGLSVLVLIGCAGGPPLHPTRVEIPGARIFPESMTSTRAGDLIVGSIGEGTIARAKAGSSTAEPWIPAGSNGLLSVFGVLADDRSRTLWVCSNEASNAPILARPGEPTTALLSFDLSSGKPKGRYLFPGSAKSLCNDIATGADGAVFVTDTRNPRVLRLAAGASALEVWVQDEALQGGPDGIAFVDRNTLLVNTISSGHLIRIELRADGSAGAITQLQTSRPLEHPDGMRPAGHNRFLLAEGVGRVSVLTLNGNSAALRTLKEGLSTPSGVTSVGRTAWYVEGKFPYRTDPKFKDQSPGPFFASSVPLEP